MMKFIRGVGALLLALTSPIVAVQGASAQLRGDEVVRVIDRGSTRSVTVSQLTGSTTSGTPVDAFARFRAATAAVKADAATSDAVIQVISDSLAAGALNISGSTTYVGGRAAAWPTRLASLITAAGTPAQAANWFGSGAINPTATPDQYIPGMTAGSGWGFITTGTISVGGRPIENNTTTNPLAWAPNATTSLSLNAIDLYHLQDTGFGTFTYAVDGGAATTVNSDGARGIIKTTISLGAANTSHILTITRVSGRIQLQGMEAYNTNQRVVRIRNIAMGSSATANWRSVSAPWNPGAVIGGGGGAAMGLPGSPAVGASGMFDASLNIVALGINDGAQDTVGNNLATQQTNMTEIVSYLQRSVVPKDIILLDPTPVAGSAVPVTRQAATSAIVQSVAAASGANVTSFSLTKRYTDWATLQANGFAGSADGLHFNKVGYQDIAEYVLSVLRFRGL